MASWPIFVVGVLAVVAVMGVLLYEDSRPVANYESVLLSYTSSTPWQNATAGPAGEGTNVSVSWTDVTHEAAGHLAVVEGGRLVFDGNLPSGNATFRSDGGPLTVSAIGLTDPVISVHVLLSWTGPAGLPPI